MTISQTNNTGGYSLSTCSSVTVSQPTSGTFVVTPIAAGTCTLTATGSGGQTASVAVTVTTTGIVVK